MIAILLIVLSITDCYVVGMIVKMIFGAMLKKTDKSQILCNILGLAAGICFSLGLGYAFLHNKIDTDLALVLMIAPIVIVILAAIILPLKK